MGHPPENLKEWLRLNLISGITREKYLTLLNNFGNPENVFKSKKSDLQRAGPFDEEFVSKIFSPPTDNEVERELNLISKHNVSLLTIDDSDYPINLKYVQNPPPLLYIKGKIEKCDRFSITIVGTRNPTEYGKWAAKRFAEQLSRWSLTIVSGMAIGIDSAAHRAALSVDNGRTIAVLGNGLARCYPSLNRKLMEQISSNGAVISEFPMETQPEAYNFPKRNEILSGLSLATLVIEARETSGSLITARLAIEGNKFVFALPGDINRETSKGTNLLLRSGAIPVLSPEDVINDLNPQLKAMLKESMPESVERHIPTISEDALSEKEKIVYALIKREPCSLDDLIFILSEKQISHPDLLNLLLQLELKSLIEKLPGQIYTIKG